MDLELWAEGTPRMDVRNTKHSKKETCSLPQEVNKILVHTKLEHVYFQYQISKMKHEPANLVRRAQFPRQQTLSLQIVTKCLHL